MSNYSNIKWIRQELLINASLILGFSYSLETSMILTISINLFLSLLFNILKYLFLKTQKKEFQQYKLIKLTRLVMISIQFAFKISILQFGLLVLNLFKLKQYNIYFILLIIFLNSLINNTIELSNPASIVLYLINLISQFGFSIFEYYCKKKIKQEQSFQDLNAIYIEQTFKQKSSNPQKQTVEPKNNEKESHSNNELHMNSDIKLISHNNLQKKDDDDLILQNMPWLSNQSALAIDDNLVIVWQSFYLGKLKRASIHEDPQFQDDQKNLEQFFLDTYIEMGSKEVNEILTQPEIQESIYSDDPFQLNALSDYHRYHIKQCLTIHQLCSLLMNDYDRWRFSTITLYKFRSTLYDLDQVLIKIILQTIENRKFFIFLFEEQRQIKLKSSVDLNQSVLNIFSTFVHESVSYVNGISTFLLLEWYEADSTNTKQFDKVLQYHTPMRMLSQRFTLFLNSMRDYIFYIQNQLFLKISAFRISDLVDELILVYQDNLKIRQVGVITSIDLNENNQIIFSDLERLKQVLACLLTYCLKYTTSGHLKFDVKTYTVSGVMISFKDSTIAKDENAKRQISGLVRSLNIALKNSRQIYEVDLNNPLELQLCCLLSYQLSGSFKRGLEFLYDSNGNGTFTFVVESQSTPGKPTTQYQDTGPIRILGQRRYFETSLSLLLAQDSSLYKEDSKVNSLTYMSKQFSIKPDPMELQSAYLSQISKIKQDSSNSRQFQNSNSNQKQSNSLSFSGTNKYNQDSLMQQTIKNTFSKNNKPSSHCKSDSNHDSLKTHSILDFGAESSNNSIHPPILFPKLLPQVIKFRLRKDCCSKVLIVDNDHYSVMALQCVLAKYDIKTDRAFNGIEAQKNISQKRDCPCHCGNKFYVLYFIELHLPVLSGLDLIRILKENMSKSQIDKGIIIALSTYVDLNQKLECFKSGIDYFLSKPFDLLDIGATVSYLDGQQLSQ